MAKRTKRPEPREVTLADAVSEAIGEFTTLGEEFREICDNTPDSLQGSELYETRDATASTLEGIDEPSVPESLSEIKVTIQDQTPRRRGYSRAARCEHSIYILQTCIDALHELEDNDDAYDFASDLENIVGEAEGCEFPGMFG